MSEVRIGFVPMSDSLRHPFDLRNFMYYSRKRNLSFEIADPGKDYDLIVLSPRADISIWSRFKGKAKLIYFLADSYLALSPYDLKGALRGLAKFAGGEHKYLKLNYSSAVKEMCKRANAVVCTTVEQKKDITPYCAHVHVILDFQFDMVRQVKAEYSQGKRINLVWEGQAENINGFILIKEALIELRKKYPITLHLITDLERKKYMNVYRKVSVVEELKHIFGPSFVSNTVNGKESLVYLYQWNLEMISRIITACDIALIPLDINNPLQCGKPENKLLLFWRMGVPAVVSDTPAYRRVMSQCAQELYCRDTGDWIVKLELLIQDQKKRQDAAERGKAYAESAYSESAYLKQWDRLFASVLSE